MILALALLGGIVMRMEVFAGTVDPEGAAGLSAVSVPHAQGDESAGDRSLTDHTTTISGHQRPSTGSGSVSDGTTLFLWYDAVTGRFGYTDKTGTLVIEPLFERAGQFREGLAPVRYQGDPSSPGYGYIDTTGALVIEPRFTKAFAFQEGLARVDATVGDLYRYGYIDRTGAMVIEPRYPAAWDFSQGLARVALSDASGAPRYGFIDRTGAMVIDPIFEAAKDFAEGLAAVAIDGRWGFIDRSGAMVIEPCFSYASSFMPWGQAEVDLEQPGTPMGDGAPAGDAGDEDHGFHQARIDKTGKVVWERGTQGAQ